MVISANFSRIALIITTLVSALSVPAVAFGEFEFIKIIDSATPRPDGEGNFTFHVYYVDATTDGEHVVFRTEKTGRADGIWSSDMTGNNLTELVDWNTAVPGGVGTFTDIGRQGGAPQINTPLTHNGIVLFPGFDSSLPVAKPGIYTVPVEGGTVRKIADLNTIVPRGSGAFQALSYITGQFGNLAIGENKVIFSAQGTGAQLGLYSANFDGSDLDVVAHEKNPMHTSSGPLYEIRHFNRPGADGNHAVFTGGSVGGGLYGLYSSPTIELPQLPVDTEAGYTELLSVLTILPGATGIINTIYPQIFLDGNTVIFSARHSAGAVRGIYTIPRQGGPITKIVDSTDSLPGMSTINHNASFESYSAGDGDIAFYIHDNSGKKAIFRYRSGVIEKVVATGDVINGRTVYDLGHLGYGATKGGFIVFSAYYTFVQGAPSIALLVAGDECSFDSDHDGTGDCIDKVDENGLCIGDSEDCAHQKLRSIACVGVNGFLGQVNIASVQNLLGIPLDVNVQYFDLSGALKGEAAATINPNLKRDFVVNDMGLQPDTIGQVCVTTNAANNGAWTGGVAIYKPDTRNGPQPFGTAFDFALFYPFLNPSKGITVVPLNTFHLGTDPAALVANWISISDASAVENGGSNGNSPLTGIVQYLNDQGVVVAQDDVSVPPGGRNDYSGHLGLSGVQNTDQIGMARFIPDDPTAPYNLTVTRYFYDCPGASCTNFLTAFNIPYRPGVTFPIFGGVSTANDEISIIELNNTGPSAAAVDINVFDSAGTSAGSQQMDVPSRGTRHVIVNKVGDSGFLLSNLPGSSQVALQSGSVSSLSLFYKLENNRLIYAYAAPFVGPPGVAQTGQFNSFITHDNIFETYNPSALSTSVEVDFVDFTGANVFSQNFTLPGHGTARLDKVAIPANTLGSVIVNSGTPVVVRSYVSRPAQYTLPFGAQ